jgi:hypothetical protein
MRGNLLPATYDQKERAMNVQAELRRAAYM